MSVVQINVKVEENLKKDVDAVLNAIGISTTDAVRVFFKRVVMDKGFPFELTAQKQYNTETLNTIKRSEDDENLIQMGSVENLMHFLNEDN
ncbi:MAG: type II toxin-antitoxin system RelB/DinJ family antitoxin [Alphaproteobacteria bacterium]